MHNHASLLKTFFLEEPSLQRQNVASTFMPSLLRESHQLTTKHIACVLEYLVQDWIPCLFPCISNRVCSSCPTAGRG